jgi:hypothetical protein
LFAAWVVLLIVEGPEFIGRLNHIRTATVPGVDRSSALQRVVIDAGVELIAFPGLLVAMLGYGIVVDRTAGFNAAAQ